jgi:hypothetical protein
MQAPEPNVWFGSDPCAFDGVLLTFFWFSSFSVSRYVVESSTPAIRGTRAPFVGVNWRLRGCFPLDFRPLCWAAPLNFRPLSRGTFFRPHTPSGGGGPSSPLQPSETGHFFLGMPLRGTAGARGRPASLRLTAHRTMRWGAPASALPSHRREPQPPINFLGSHSLSTSGQ